MGASSSEAGEGEPIPACVPSWVERWPGSLRGVDGVALDDQGRTYAAGWSRTELDGDMDAWVECWAASGEQLWAHAWGDALGDERAIELARAPTDELYVVIQGWPTGAALLRLDPLTGEELWGRAPSSISALAVGETGEVVLARDQGMGASLAKYSVEGEELWLNEEQPALDLQGLRLERVFVVPTQAGEAIWALARAWQDDLQVELIVRYAGDGALLGAEVLEPFSGIRDVLGRDNELLLLTHSSPELGELRIESRDPLSGALLDARTLSGLSFLPYERDAWAFGRGPMQSLDLVGHRNDLVLERGVLWMGQLADGAELPTLGCEYELERPQPDAPAWFRVAPHAATHPASGVSVRATVSTVSDAEELESGEYWTWLAHFEWP